MFIWNIIQLPLFWLVTVVSSTVHPDDEQHLLASSRELRQRNPVLGSQYYTLRKDYRECLSPQCGGYFVQALNQIYTQCHNRKLSLEGCYVAALDLSSFTKTAGLDQSRFLDAIMNSDGGIVLGSYKRSTAYPGLEGQYADLVVEAGWAPFEEDTNSEPLPCDCVPDDEGPVCDCGRDEVCVDDPSDDCFGCACPTICRSNSQVVCGGLGDGTECPPNLVCIIENPFCCSDDCGRICVAVDEKQKSPSCGGIAGLECLVGQICIYQDCDPKIAGADCGGVCVQKIGAFCGGIAGFPCYDGLECVDPLGDGCDNQCNGADCGGICLPGVSPE